MGFYCHDEYEHRSDARRDARYGRRDYDYYDRFSDDPCKQAYTEEYNRERIRLEDRAREEEAQREQEERVRQRQAYEAEQEYYRQAEEEQFHEMEQDDGDI